MRQVDEGNEVSKFTSTVASIRPPSKGSPVLLSDDKLILETLNYSGCSQAEEVIYVSLTDIGGSNTNGGTVTF